MSPDSSKRDESLSLSCVKRSLHVRRKRLENRRLKAVSSREDLASLGDGNSADVSKLEDDARVCVAKKTRLANNEVVTVCQSRNDGDTELKTDACSDELPSNHSSLSSASSSSSENEGVPMLVGGGEVFGRGDKLRILPCLSHGSASVCGRRREMEDAVTVVPGFLNEETGLYDFFAVYDGHGGARVAQVCRERLHRLLAKEIEGREASEVATKREEDIKWEEVMLASFAKMDEEINGDEVVVEDGSSSLKTIGSTAVVALVGTEKVVVANCGDSRAVLSRGGVAIPLSRDHKPDRPDEMERVEAAGGRVINWNGYRILGVLATSRSIGDQYLKPYVICEPEVTVSKRTGREEFLILASDGLWDVVSNEVACEVVRRCLDGRIMRKLSGMGASGAAEAAAVLAELAMARGSKDNISVVVVDLRPHHGLNIGSIS